MRTAANFMRWASAALDWLNKITDNSFRFFGLALRLWRIGTSPAAPRFNVISKPNDWSQSVKQAARVIDDADLTETKVRQRDYWVAFNSVLNSNGGPVSGNKKAQPQSWISYPVGKAAVHLGAAMSSFCNQIRAELHLSAANAKAFFDLLKKQKEAIEQELGCLMQWEELPAGQDSPISVSVEEANLKNTDDWKRQHEWLAKKLNDMHLVFSRRVKELSADDWQPEDNR